MENNNKKLRQFGITTAALNNKNTVFLIIALLIIVGISAYIGMPKEMFPDVTLPKIMVKSVYPGNSPNDMESLVTRPLETEISDIKGIKKMSSTSTQDNTDMLIEFNSGIDLKQASQDIKDAVDNAKNDLPDDLPFDPMVIELDASEFPIININLSGDFSLNELKNYAEMLEDEIDALPEVSKVNIKGVEDRQIRVNLDKSKMDAFDLSFTDIENAINYENMTISGGDLIIGQTRRSVRTAGEFKNIHELENIIVKSEQGKTVYLRDVIENGKVIDGYKDILSLARLNDNPVVSLQVIKKSGQNLISASNHIFDIIAKAKKTGALPASMTVSITNDQSDKVKNMIHNLENSIIMGMLFVIWVLFFFLGTRNAILVGMSIPTSMLISFVILNTVGASINMMVLFGLILSLGMLVDNAIVAVENIHRFMLKGYKPFQAAKLAVGEIAWAIIASTATTLAAFIPLMFWPGMIGEFMKFLPITLVVVLSSSLFVALVIIPVITATFASTEQNKPPFKRTLIITGTSVGLAALLYISGNNIPASLLVIAALITVLNYYVFYDVSIWFQKVALVKLENIYLKVLKFSLSGKKPGLLMLMTFLLLVFTIFLLGIRQPEVTLFPINEPNFLIVEAELPVGYDITATDSIMKLVEKDINRILIETKFRGDGNKEDVAESVLTTIGKGAVGQNKTPIGNTPNKAITTINFIDFERRRGTNTSELMRKLSEELIGKFPGVTISVEKNIMGPPTGKPINIEIAGEKFETLIKLGDTILHILDNEDISGIEGLTPDLNSGKPELFINIDREAARRFGLSTGQIAGTIRTALFGKEVSDFKIGEEEIPIQIQLSKKYRNDISTLMNQIITFRNKRGKFVHVPISAVATDSSSTSYNAIKRIDNKRVITLSSNLIEGANGTKINRQLDRILSSFKFPEGYGYKLTGEQQDQKEASAFLSKALLVAVFFIIIIMVTQFNSVIKPVIIMISVLFSTIGVFGGIATFGMSFVIIMTGVGIISLAGVVVNNAIVLIDYIDYLKKLKKQELGLEPEDNLPFSDIVEAITTGGKTRLRPVLLTAITTILGLIPMATGLNIDFGGLLESFSPDIYFGGDNAVFWGPMAWTVIFGLTFATFLTLVMVPVMYLIGNRLKLRLRDRSKLKN